MESSAVMSSRDQLSKGRQVGSTTSQTAARVVSGRPVNIDVDDEVTKGCQFRSTNGYGRDRNRSRHGHREVPPTSGYDIPTVQAHAVIAETAIATVVDDEDEFETIVPAGDGNIYNYPLENNSSNDSKDENDQRSCFKGKFKWALLIVGSITIISLAAIMAIVFLLPQQSNQQQTQQVEDSDPPSPGPTTNPTTSSPIPLDDESSFAPTFDPSSNPTVIPTTTISPSHPPSPVPTSASPTTFEERLECNVDIEITACTNTSILLQITEGSQLVADLIQDVRFDEQYVINSDERPIRLLEAKIVTNLRPVPFNFTDDVSGLILQPGERLSLPPFRLTVDFSNTTRITMFGTVIAETLATNSLQMQCNGFTFHECISPGVFDSLTSSSSSP